MKRYIHCETSQNIQDNASLVKFLQSKGIDTTKNKYNLKYKFYGRCGEDEKFDVKFTCPGDYLALFSTRLAGLDSEEAIPNFINIDNYFGIDEFVKIVESNPTFADLYKTGDYDEWFGREEFGHIQLVNLTTGKTLVEDMDEDDYEEDEYDEDWED